MRIAPSLATLSTLYALALPAWAACPLDAGTTAPDDRTCYVSTTGDDTAAGTRGAPLRNIQTAIDIAFDLDAFQTIRVLPGTYNECPNAFFEVDVGGQPVPVPTNLDIVSDDFIVNGTRTTTIIDGTSTCGVNVPGPLPAVVTIGDLGKLRGFTIRGGGNSGVYGLGHVQITNNVISGNTSAAGGGIYLYTGEYVTDPANFKATIVSNLIEDNTADFDGGGISVRAYGFDGVASDLTIDQNVITDNQVGGGNTTTFGGGAFVITHTGEVTDVSRVAITANTIDGNTALPGAGGLSSYGGGLAVLTFGFGQETIDVGGTTSAASNAIRNNTAQDGYGGGLAALAQGSLGATHRLRVQTNAVTANTSELGGGGMYLLTLALSLDNTTTTQLLVRANNVSGNSATAPIGNVPNPAGGGGIYADFYNERSMAPAVTLEILGNTLRQNVTDSWGGGAALYARAYNESIDDPELSPASSTITFKNNLVVLNDAAGATVGVRDGGGAYAVGVGSGTSTTANLELGFNTYADNDVDPAGGGGVALEAITSADINGGLGAVDLDVHDSIFLRNDAYGIGGPAVPGFTNVTASIRYNDFFQNSQGTIAANLSGSATNTLTVNPGLDANFLAPFCSATIDAGDPTAGTFVGGRLQEEAQPNSGVANLGHTGLTSSATITLPDVNGSGRVDGVDVLDLAFAFASTSSQPRYDEDADRDGDGDVDGDDLSYVAAFFGRTCP